MLIYTKIHNLKKNLGHFHAILKMMGGFEDKIKTFKNKWSSNILNKDKLPVLL